jgi:hypothetical protein
MPPQIVLVFSTRPREPMIKAIFNQGIIVMSETIVLKNDHPEVVRGIVKDSSVLCSATSASDVFIHVITPSDTAELFQGDGTVIPKMTKARFRVFRKSPGDDPFSATVVVTDLPASATEKSKTLMAAFGLVKHKPGGLKIKKAKKTAKKAVKKPAKKKKAKRG